jgi:enhancing lycopene biosynthesis protein 2
MISVHTGGAQINEALRCALDAVKKSIEPRVAGLGRRRHCVIDHLTGEIGVTYRPVKIERQRLRARSFDLPKTLGACGETAHARTSVSQAFGQAPAGISATDD